MSSYDYGKPEVCAWIRRHFPPDAAILDVGACDGKWRRLLPEYPNMDAVEAFEPNLTRLQGYRSVFHSDICDFSYDWYDLIIFGDIVEHLSVEAAKNELEYARGRCRDMIVAVPFRYEQGALVFIDASHDSCINLRLFRNAETEEELLSDEALLDYFAQVLPSITIK